MTRTADSHVHYGASIAATSVDYEVSFVLGSHL